MECRLSHAPNEWSCQIKIRWEYHEGFRIRGQVHEVDFGPRLFDKSQVELMLRRAQAAVLNPSLPLSTFIRMDEKALLRPTDPPSVDFSRNVVCIELSGPDLADLSFVDLPGTIFAVRISSSFLSDTLLRNRAECRRGDGAIGGRSCQLVDPRREQSDTG